MSETKPFYKHPKDSIAPKALKRIPHKTASFKFPPQIAQKDRLKYETRKVNLISAKVFKAPARGREEQFLGSLRIL